VDLHFFLETLALWNDEIDDAGSRTDVSQVFLNPGGRYAVCQFDEVEWVLGIAVPIGLTDDTPDIGMFAYMSVERPGRLSPKIRQHGLHFTAGEDFGHVGGNLHLKVPGERRGVSRPFGP